MGRRFATVVCTLGALTCLSLNIRQGEFFAFLGPNAAGKTTTIKMLAGLLRPTGGACSVGGFDVQREPEAAKSVLSYAASYAHGATSTHRCVALNQSPIRMVAPATMFSLI